MSEYEGKIAMGQWWRDRTPPKGKSPWVLVLCFGEPGFVVTMREGGRRRQRYGVDRFRSRFERKTK